VYRDMRYVVDLRHALQAPCDAMVRVEGREKTYIHGLLFARHMAG
jgi:hypothetical protein